MRTGRLRLCLTTQRFACLQKSEVVGLRVEQQPRRWHCLSLNLCAWAGARLEVSGAPPCQFLLLLSWLPSAAAV